MDSLLGGIGIVLFSVWVILFTFIAVGFTLWIPTHTYLYLVGLGAWPLLFWTFRSRKLTYFLSTLAGIVVIDWAVVKTSQAVLLAKGSGTFYDLYSHGLYSWVDLLFGGFMLGQGWLAVVTLLVMVGLYRGGKIALEWLADWFGVDYPQNYQTLRGIFDRALTKREREQEERK